ncbi:MAG TPA: carboxylesterase family protein [Vicinamibacterales bacterium]|nr:carboxylesterase family protein [Vicinamibacterales bacterium]
MMKRMLVIATLIEAASLMAGAAPDVVRVDGGQLRGTSSNGVRVFKGIPFAAAPVGELRWKAPQPAASWSGVRNADAYGPECMQQAYPDDSPYASAPQPMSEDCLYLNVWTAARSKDKQAVMFWIHGGDWTRGSASMPSYDGSTLAKKGVVVVTANYRLGVLGFLAHPELTRESPNRASGNYAILDHLAALNWVRRNIAAFGGDPSRVTIFGESAGAWSVNVLQATPLAKGLFHRAIGESGAQFTGGPTLAAAERRGAAVAREVGADSLTALRAMPARELLEVEVASFRPGANTDGYVLPEDVPATFGHKKQNQIPVLVGSNANEMTTLSDAARFPTTLDEFRKQMAVQFPGHLRTFDVAYPVTSEAQIPETMLSVGRDRTYTAEMRRWARAVTAAGQKAFLYHFTHVPPSPNARTWRAYHAAEIPYVFGTLRARNWPFTDVDFTLADRMSTYWSNFATKGDPNGKLPTWTAYDETDEPYLELGDTVTMKHHLLQPQLDFLDEAALRRRPTHK